MDARSLAKAVELRLGRAAIESPARAERAIEGRIEPMKQGGYRASFALTGPLGAALGTREIEGSSADCRAMDADLSLVIALMIDPDAATPKAPDPTPPPPAPPGSATPFPAPSPLAAPRFTAATPAVESKNTGYHVALRGGVVGAIGLLPSAAIGVGVRATGRLRWGFPFEVEGVYWAPQQATSAGGGFGAEVWMALGGLSVCPLTGHVGGLSWGACAGVAAGMAHVGGFGLDVERAEDVPLVNLTLGAQVRRTLAGPLFGALGLGIAAPLARLGLYYDTYAGRREVFVAPPVAGTGELSLGLELL